MYESVVSVSFYGCHTVCRSCLVMALWHLLYQCYHIVKRKVYLVVKRSYRRIVATAYELCLGSVTL